MSTMRISSNYRGVKGFVTVYNRAIQFRYMVTKEAKRRMKILIFWEHHGLDATLEAFEIKRRALFNWKRKLREGGGKIESLNNTSRAPHTKRKRSWDIRVLDEIKRLRDVHPNLGAKKILPLLLDFCDCEGRAPCPQKSTIERLIQDLGGLRVAPQKITGTGRIVQRKRIKVQRKPKGFKAVHPGHCIALDTIEKQRNGTRMYILTAIDIYSRTAFAIGTKSHASKTAAHFFHIITQLFTYPIKQVLTDNGSEFKLHFTRLMGMRKYTHLHTYPRTPKMNAHCERFNRTIQEEFIDYHIDLLFDDTTEFNRLLGEYLEFYNTKRVHHAFKNEMTPVEVISKSKYYLSTLPAECNNGWGYTGG